MKSSNSDQAKRYKIYVLGNQSAGKSCLLAGLEILSELDRPSAVSVTALNASKNVLAALAESIRDGVFPSSTTSTATLETEIRLKNNHLSCTWIDYPGERFMTSYGRGEGLFTQEVANVLDGDFFLVALAPEDYLPSAEAGLEDVADPQACVDRTMAIRSALEHVRRERKNNPPHVAILLTKADAFCKNPIKPWEAERYLEQHAPVVLRNLKDIFSECPVFAISAVGNCIRADGQPLQPDKRNLNPWGYDHVCAWMIKQITREKRRPVLRGVFVGILVGMVLVMCVFLYRQYTQDKANTTVQDLVRRGQVANQSQQFETAFKGASPEIKNAEVDKLIDRASQLNGSSSLSDHEAIRDELKVVRKESSGYRLHEIDERIKKIDATIESTRFESVKSALTDDAGNSLQLAHDFLAEYPSSQYRDKVQQLLANRTASERQKALNILKGLTVDSPQGIRQYIDQLTEFVNKYNDLLKEADARQAMRLAEKLASQLESNNPMEVELKSLGELTTKAYIQLKVFLGDGLEPVYEEQSKEMVTVFGFDKAFKVPWRLGEEVRVEIYLDPTWRRSYFEGNMLVAHTKFSETLSISSLDWPLEFGANDGIVVEYKEQFKNLAIGSISPIARLLVPVEPGFSNYKKYMVGEKLQLQADVLGWEPKEWILLQEWIFPPKPALENLANAE